VVPVLRVRARSCCPNLESQMTRPSRLRIRCAVSFSKAFSAVLLATLVVTKFQLRTANRMPWTGHGPFCRPLSLWDDKIACAVRPSRWYQAYPVLVTKLPGTLTREQTIHNSGASSAKKCPISASSAVFVPCPFWMPKPQHCSLGGAAWQ